MITQTPSFLDSPPDTSTPACVSLGLNGSNWIDHQDVENFFSLKTLSLFEGKIGESEEQVKFGFPVAVVTAYRANFEKSYLT